MGEGRWRNSGPEILKYRCKTGSADSPTARRQLLTKPTLYPRSIHHQQQPAAYRLLRSYYVVAAAQRRAALSRTRQPPPAAAPADQPPPTNCTNTYRARTHRSCRLKGSDTARTGFAGEPLSNHCLPRSPVDSVAPAVVQRCSGTVLRAPCLTWSRVQVHRVAEEPLRI